MQSSRTQQSETSSNTSLLCSWEGAAELSAAPTTPSLLYNNLTESDELLAYCSGSRVSVVRLSQLSSFPPDAECFVQGEQASLIASVELKHHRDAFATSAIIVRPPPEVANTYKAAGRSCAALVVATTATVDFFELPEPGRPASSALLVHTTNLTETPVNPLARIMSRGLATLPSKTPNVTVLTGTATGVVLMHTVQFRLPTGNPDVDSASPHFTVVSGPSMQTPCCSITCIAVPSAPLQEKCAVARWLCADDDGCICIYEKTLESLNSDSKKTLDSPSSVDGEGDDAERAIPVSSAPSTSTALGWERVGLFAGNGVPCSCAAFLPDPNSSSTTPDYIVAAYTSGHVRLLSLVTNSVVAEIAAHSRSITALAVHPRLPCVVSVAEDSWVRAWALWHNNPPNPAVIGSARHGRGGSSGGSDGVSNVSADSKQQSSRMQKFDVTQQWSAFMPFFLWTGVCFVPHNTSSSEPVKHDISVVAYDLGAIFTFHAKPLSGFNPV